MGAARSIISTLAVTAALTVAGTSQAATPTTPVERALASCLSRVSGGQFADPLRPGEAAPPAAGDTVGQALVASGDPVARVAGGPAGVYIVEPKGQCVVDTFGLNPADTLARTKALTEGAPYNGAFGGSADTDEIKMLNLWNVDARGTPLKVLFGLADEKTQRIIIMVSVDDDQ